LELSKNGYQVIGLSRSKFHDPKGYGIQHNIENILSLQALNEMKDVYGIPQCIIHCAGSSSVTISLDKPREDFKANLCSTLDILEFSRINNSKIIVVIPSSAAVYGDVQDLPFQENGPKHPISPYGIHKHMVEELAKEYGEVYHVPVACVRLFSVYGVGLQKQLLWDACVKASKGDFSFFGTGNEVRDWIHVTDAARLLYLAVMNASSDCPIVNGGSGIGLSTKEVLSLLGSYWKPKLTPLFTGNIKHGDPMHYIADIQLMRKWGFTPIKDMNQALFEYVQWFRSIIIQ
jgi:UDP-glucose 4-epimerase